MLLVILALYLVSDQYQSLQYWTPVASSEMHALSRPAYTSLFLLYYPCDAFMVQSFVTLSEMEEDVRTMGQKEQQFYTGNIFFKLCPHSFLQNK